MTSQSAFGGYYRFATRPYGREKRLTTPLLGRGVVLLLCNSEPHFAGTKGFCFVQKSLENISKSARRGAKRRGGRTTTYNMAPCFGRNPNFLPAKSAGFC